MTDKNKMNMTRSLTDPCMIYEKSNSKLKLMTGVNVDNTFALGRKEDLKEFTNKILERFNITIQKTDTKHLGVNYEWGEDKFGQYPRL